MIKNMLTQLWNQRRTNGWLFAELLVVFILLWYCIDMLYHFSYAEHQSKGYNIDCTYRVEVNYNPTQNTFTRNVDSLERFWQKPLEEVMRRIRNHPEVEAAAMWLGTDAYSAYGMFQGYTTDSAHVVIAKIRYVTEEYCQVFQTELLRGGQQSWDPYTTPLPAIVSEELADSLFQRKDVIGEEFFDFYEPQLRYRVTGVMASQKGTDYSRYEPYIITPMPYWSLSSQVLPYISIRVRPEANVGFAGRFLREMTPSLQIAPFYLFNVQSYDEQKTMRDANEGITSYITSARMIIVFFVVNVFLGLMGTFWFRTRHRRSEIGLRMAMGSSRARVRGQLMGEGLLLLTFAMVPATVVCGNMVVADITLTDATDAGYVRFFISLFVTWLLMALMVVAGIWFPARQAMKIQSAEALHEE